MLNDSSEGRLTRRYRESNAIAGNTNNTNNSSNNNKMLLGNPHLSPRKSSSSRITISSGVAESSSSSSSSSSPTRTNGSSMLFSAPHRIKSNDFYTYANNTNGQHLSLQTNSHIGSLPSMNSGNVNNLFWLKMTVVVLLVLLVAVSIAGVMLFLNLKQANSEPKVNPVELEINRLMLDLEQKLESDQGMGQIVRELQKKLETALTEKEDLKNTVQSLEKDKKTLEEASKYAPALRGNDEFRKQIEYLDTYRTRLHAGIQAMAKQRLVEKWGKGPHRVQISLKFDPTTLQPDQAPDGTIVLELAPVDDMPYTVYWFLEQVTRKLFDGCSFHRNAGHVIQAGPAINFMSPPSPMLLERFTNAGFNTLLFQEYSHNFPHVMYTIGYAGRPGGPDFYINVKDNHGIHGPGGQPTAQDPNEADPCFAKVISGFDVVDRIHQAPVRPNDIVMQNNVAITEMKLL